MPRAAITVNQIPVSPVLHKAITWTNGNSTDDHTLANSGRTLLLITNTSGGAAAIKVVSVAESRYGRTYDIDTTVANGATRILGPFPPEGFNQSDGTIQINTDVGGATCTFAGIELPY